MALIIGLLTICPIAAVAMSFARIISIYLYPWRAACEHLTSLGNDNDNRWEGTSEETNTEWKPTDGHREQLVTWRVLNRSVKWSCKEEQAGAISMQTDAITEFARRAAFKHTKKNLNTENYSNYFQDLRTWHK